MSDLIKKEVLVPLKNFTREDIKNIALEFATSDIPPLERALIVYALKKLINDIETFDKSKYEQELKNYWEANKNSSSAPMIGDFQIIRKEITKRVYLNPQKAKELEEQIKALKDELDKLEYYEETIKHTYYIKHKGDK